MELLLGIMLMGSFACIPFLLIALKYPHLLRQKERSQIFIWLMMDVMAMLIFLFLASHFHAQNKINKMQFNQENMNEQPYMITK